jgi:hypothetical protein
MVHHLLALHLDLGDRRILLHDKVIHVVKHLRQLNHLTLDLLDRFVTRADSVHGALSLALSGGVHHSLLEHLLRIRVLDSFTNFLFRSIGAYDAVLTSRLLVRPLSVLSLNLHILLVRLLQRPIHPAHLRLVSW